MVVIIEQSQSLSKMVKPIRVLVISFLLNGPAKNSNAIFKGLNFLLLLGQPFFIDGVALNEVVLEPLRGPDSELCAWSEVYPVAYRQNKI